MELVNKKDRQIDLYILNWTRGVCAALVVLGHARSLGWAHGESTNLWSSNLSKIFLLPSSFAMESVAVFFVISGYLVGGQIYRQIIARSFLWPRFLVDRITRLYIVLIPGMVFTFLCFLFSKYFGKELSTSNFGVGNFLCNITFLMPTRCGPYGNNSSLWSLGYEFYFYIIFAAICTLFQLQKS